MNVLAEWRLQDIEGKADRALRELAALGRIKENFRNLEAEVQALREKTQELEAKLEESERRFTSLSEATFKLQMHSMPYGG